MRIVNRMTRNPETVSPEDTVAVARALMDAGGFRRMPVMEKGKLVGIISDRDVRKHLGSLETTKVATAMTRDPITITPQTTVEQAARLMLMHRVGGLPVLEDGKLVGILTTTDVLKAFLDVIRASQEIMNP